MKPVAEIRVLSADTWEKRSELRVAERPGERDQSADDPRSEHERRGFKAAGDDRRIDEDARSDDAADHNHRGIESPERTRECHALEPRRPDLPAEAGSHKE